MTYREMTPEEKLEYNKELLEALIKNSFMGADIVHEKWKLKLSSREQINDTMKKTFDPETLMLHEKAMSEADEKKHISHPHIEQLSTKSISHAEPKTASIYAAEHLSLVQEDLNGPRTPREQQPKTKVLEQERPAPNLYGNAVTVEPGEVQELLRGQNQML